VLALLQCQTFHPSRRLSLFGQRVATVQISSFELSSIKTQVSSIKNGRIRCFLLIQLKLETRVLILETPDFIEHNIRLGTCQCQCSQVQDPRRQFRKNQKDYGRKDLWNRWVL